MPNTDRLINHQDGLDMISQLTAIASAILGNSSIAPIEVSPTINAYAQGDLLLYNHTLYKAKTAIAVGTTLVVNTNIEETTIEDEIKSAASTGGVTGVKGATESTYRTGNVNITPADIGALSTESSQSLTPSEQATAQTNIGVVAASSQEVQDIIDEIWPVEP